MLRVADHALQATGNRAVIHGVAHTQAHTGNQALVRLTAQVNDLAAGRGIPLRLLAGGDKNFVQGLTQCHKLLLRQGLGSGNGDCQLLPVHHGQDVAGPGRHFLSGFLNKLIHQRNALRCELVFLQRLCGFLRYLTEHLGADLPVHDGAQLPLPLLRVPAQHIGLLLTAFCGGSAVLLHLLPGICQQVFLLLSGLLLLQFHLGFDCQRIFLRPRGLLQLMDDLFLAFLKHPDDHLAGNEKQCTEQDHEVGYRK